MSAIRLGTTLEELGLAGPGPVFDDWSGKATRARRQLLQLDPSLQHLLRTQRQATEHNARLVLQLSLIDPGFLPRWHQDDRGSKNTHRGVHVLAPAGAYAHIPVWRDRLHWLTYVVPVAVFVNRDLMRKRRIGRALFIEWALAKSGLASHWRTGRRCIARPDRIAETLGCSKRQVQKMNAFAREIGLERVVLEGRMLTLEESTGARRRGSRQRGLSTEVVLTCPAWLWSVVDSFTPTRGRATRHISARSRTSPHGLAAIQKGSAPPTPVQERAASRRRARDLARRVTREVLWLAQERPGRLAPALSRFANAEQPWSAEDVAGALRARSLRLGLAEVYGSQIKTRPAVVLASILREFDPVADHPAFDPFPTQPQTPATCGDDRCDHGWLEGPAGGVIPCPTCPPQARSTLWSWPDRSVDTTEEGDESTWTGEPPF